VTECGTFVADGGRRANLDQDDKGCCYGNRNDGMENDAEGAVIGVGFKGVGMGNLGDGQEGKQDEAEDGGRDRRTGRDGNRSASSLLEFVQRYLHLRIHRFGRSGRWSGCEAM
jgi:hypothetical protein